MRNTGVEYSSTDRTPVVLPELAGLLPPLTEEQMAALETDLLKNGCYSPIIVNEDLIIVDGHNRQMLCEKHSIPYKMAVFSFEDMLEAKQWALDTQKGRRNLDKWELGKIALKLKPDIEVRARANMSAGGGDQKSEEAKSGLATLPNPISPVNARKEMADSVGLGERTMGKVMQIDEHAPPAVKEALDSRMRPDEIEDSVKEARELAEVFSTIAGLLEKMLPVEAEGTEGRYEHDPSGMA